MKARLARARAFCRMGHADKAGATDDRFWREGQNGRQLPILSTRRNAAFGIEQGAFGHSQSVFPIRPNSLGRCVPAAVSRAEERAVGRGPGCAEGSVARRGPSTRRRSSEQGRVPGRARASRCPTCSAIASCRSAAPTFGVCTAGARRVSATSPGLRPSRIRLRGCYSRCARKAAFAARLPDVGGLLGTGRPAFTMACQATPTRMDRCSGAPDFRAFGIPRNRIKVCP